MPETKFVAIVECKVPLTEADRRWLEADITRRLQATLVQKFASIKFEERKHAPS